MKIASKIAHLKYDRKYISSNDVNKLQDSFRKSVEKESKEYDYSVNVLLSKNS